MIQGQDLPLGFSEREVYQQVTIPFEPGDILVFYSDGLTEARSRAGEFFGVVRLAEFVRLHHCLHPEELIAQIRLAVAQFSGSDRYADDLTCVAVKLAERVEAVPLAHTAIEVPSELKELAQARAFVRDFGASLLDSPLDADSVGDLELAVTEALSNVIKHAYHGRAGQPIHLEADAFTDRVVFRLAYLGESFDPAAVEPPAFDGSRENGFGVYLIARSVDDVSYYRDESGRNCVCLVKNRKVT
jgi:anti-sigma regulatory factor (Ser/Thr protein kinase)